MLTSTGLKPSLISQNVPHPWPPQTWNRPCQPSPNMHNVHPEYSPPIESNPNYLKDATSLHMRDICISIIFSENTVVHQAVHFDNFDLSFLDIRSKKQKDQCVANNKHYKFNHSLHTKRNSVKKSYSHSGALSLKLVYVLRTSSITLFTALLFVYGP
jgi:hypothetical protein